MVCEQDIKVKYIPSKLEEQWNVTIREMRKSWPRLGCPAMQANHTLLQKHWLTKHLRKDDKGIVLSHFVSKNGRHPIEPLVGTLRHPDTACGIAESFHRVDWIIVDNQHTSSRRFLFVDNLYNKREEVKMLESLYKEQPFDAVTEWKQFEEASIESEDFVVVLLDDIELMQPNIISMVDEMFVDHRVLGSPMTHVWGTSSVRTGTASDITHTYALLARLRHEGIRAHAWF